jgi:GTPase SAR1 family protein
MVKVLLLGNSNIGKSDLLEYFETNQKPTHKDSTHGVQYKKLLFNDIEYHFWDFAGQYFYHATHKLFFSPSALNLILYGEDIVRDDKPFENIFFHLSYWIRSVELLNQDSTHKEEVFLLENKIDLNNNKITLNNLIEFTAVRKFFKSSDKMTSIPLFT